MCLFSRLLLLHMTIQRYCTSFVSNTVSACVEVECCCKLRKKHINVIL